MKGNSWFVMSSNERNRLLPNNSSRNTVLVGKLQVINDSFNNNTSTKINYSDLCNEIFNGIIRWIRIDRWTIEEWILVGSITGFMLFTASERVSFKMIVDRVTPFRFVYIVLTLFLLLIINGSILLYKLCFTDKITTRMKKFPLTNVAVMALIDVIQFAGLFVSASGVSPTMTVILLHASTPCFICGTFIVFPNRKYSPVQIRGSVLILIAIVISVIRPLLFLIDSSQQANYRIQYAYSSILYVFFSGVLGVATLYKERCIIQWSQPIDIHYISVWSYLFQLLYALILSPLIYLMQNFTTSTWSGFNISSFRTNVIDSLSCIQGNTPNTDDSIYDTAFTSCSYSIFIVVAFVSSNILIQECIGQVLQTSNLLLGRCVAAAVFIAFIALGIYDTKVDYGNGIFGSNITFIDVIAVVVLIAGLEMYGEDMEPDVEIITNYESVNSSTSSNNKAGVDTA